jgi:hypothetical protein
MRAYVCIVCGVSEDSPLLMLASHPHTYPLMHDTRTHSYTYMHTHTHTSRSRTSPMCASRPIWSC